jgi:hypothetical protein
MGPNDVRLVRVFPRSMGATLASAAFPSNCAFEIVVECEAGTAIHALGARYEIKIDVIDFSAMAPVVTSAVVATGNFGDANWPTHAQQLVLSLAAPGDVNGGHIWKAFASLKIGVANPHTSLVESELFLITSP